MSDSEKETRRSLANEARFGAAERRTAAQTGGRRRLTGLMVAGMLATVPSLVTAQGARPGGAAPAAAAAPPQMTIGPQISRIETASALSKEPMLAITNVRELPNGDVLVNDTGSRRLLLLDSLMVLKRVVLDSVSDVMDTYGLRAGGLLPYRADSTLFIDPASYAMLVIDPQGKIVRTRAIWRVQDATYTTGLTPGAIYGPPGIDARGRVVFRVPAIAAPPAVPPPAGVPYFPPTPDSAFVVAVDIDTRKIDTLGVVRLPKQETRVRQTGEGAFQIETINNPVPTNDDWTVLSDGTVAFIRGIDYRVEYLSANGSKTSSDKLPYDWQRLLDADKQRIVDSVKTALGRTAATTYTSAMIRWVNQYAQLYPKGFTVPEGYVAPAGFGRDWLLPQGLSLPATYIYACRAGETPVMSAAAPAPGAGGAAGAGRAAGAAPDAGAGAAGGGPVIMGPGGAGGGPVIMGPGGAGLPGGGGPVVFGPGGGGGGPVVLGPGGGGGGPVVVGPGGAPVVVGGPGGGVPSCVAAPATVAGGTVPAAPVYREPAVIPASELPDYKAPFPQTTARADMDGNIWIRPNQPRPIPGGPIYDVINRQGELVNRIQLPQAYTLVGFGRGKVVYLSMRDAQGLHLARVRLR